MVYIWNLISCRLHKRTGPVHFGGAHTFLVRFARIPASAENLAERGGGGGGGEVCPNLPEFCPNSYIGNFFGGGGGTVPPAPPPPVSYAYGRL